MSKLFNIMFSILLIVGCSTKNIENIKKETSNSYAHGFELTQNEGFKKLTVYNPWEQASNISFDYFLLKRGQVIPDSLANRNIIFTPVRKVICLSTSHIAFINSLGEIDKVTGISGGNYISNETVRKGLASGEVVDVGYDQGLNYELILSQKPDLILVYGIGGEVSAHVRKMEDMGLNVLLIAEYLEETPLGKAEWIKCIGSLFEKEKEADIFFNKISTEYNSLKKIVKDQADKPKIMMGLPYRDSWWVPGGNSYMANLISDAGGNYVGKNNSSHESYVISFENALTLAADVDIWLNVGAVYSKDEIIASDSRIAKFHVFNNGKIFNNNGKMSDSGGNGFWESGTVFPNLILKDLINIFYPELLGGEELVYYKEIK